MSVYRIRRSGSMGNTMGSLVSKFRWGIVSSINRRRMRSNRLMLLFFPARVFQLEYVPDVNKSTLPRPIRRSIRNGTPAASPTNSASSFTSYRANTRGSDSCTICSTGSESRSLIRPVCHNSHCGAICRSRAVSAASWDSSVLPKVPCFCMSSQAVRRRAASARNLRCSASRFVSRALRSFNSLEETSAWAALKNIVRPYQLSRSSGFAFSRMKYGCCIVAKSM